MKPSNLPAVSLIVALAALGFSLAACGGGGGGGTGGSDSFVADVPQAPALPDAPPQPNPDPGPAPQPGDVPDEPGDPGDVPDDPGVPPDVSDVEPLEPPEDLPTWENLRDIRAAAVDPESGLIYAASSETGEIWKINKAEGDVRRAALLETDGVRALAFDPLEKVLFAVLDRPGGADDHLLRIDPQEFGSDAQPYDAVVVGILVGQPSVESLAFDVVQRRLYAVATDSDSLLRIDPATADAVVVGDVGDFDNIVGLAPDSQERRLLGTDAQGNALVAIDYVTGEATLVGDLGERAIEGLAADATDDLLYGATVEPAEVFAFDPLGRQWAFDQILGLAFDPADDLYFGVHTPSGEILKIDRRTEQRQLVGFVPVRGLEGLAYDANGRKLYAISRLTQTLYRLSPDDAAIEEQLPVHGAAAPFLGLSGLAFDDNVLYASDSAGGGLLAIELESGNAIQLTNGDAFPRIESLAFDDQADVLHAFDNERRAYVVLSPLDANAPVEINEGALGRIGGLAWSSSERVLLGTDIDADTLVLVTTAPEPSPLGYERLVALAYRPDLAEMWAFDRNTKTLLQIDPELKIGIPIQTLDGLSIEALSFDSSRVRMVAVDAAQGDLYALGDDGTPELIGEPGILAPYDIRALAFDAGRDVFYGVDAASDVLVAIDPGNGQVTIVQPAGPGLGYDTIEGMVLDAETATLLGVDRATRMLVAIDRDLGTAEPIAQIESVEVGGLAMLPQSQILWLANAAYLVSVDRFDGDPVDPGPVLAQHAAPTATEPVRLLWPQGDIRRDALASCAVEVEAGHEGALDLELRCGDRVLHQSQLTPDGALARFQIPEKVRAALASGESITWQVGDVSAAFRVVDGSGARTDVQKVLAHPTVASRSDWERRLVEGYLLDQAGLFSEALVVGIGTYEAYPDRPTSARALLKSLERLGLVETRLGREVFLKALRP